MSKLSFVPRAKMHNEYQHPSIQLYIMSPKSSNNICKWLDRHVEEVENDEIKRKFEEDDDDSSCVNVIEDCQGDCDEEGIKLVATPWSEKLSEWEARRCGAMAASLLRDVKIT